MELYFYVDMVHMLMGLRPHRYFLYTFCMTLIKVIQPVPQKYLVTNWLTEDKYMSVFTDYAYTQLTQLVPAKTICDIPI